ncbi:hypothetical protein LPW11_18440 [Geomonas sp. RF6]|uniref:hypothetical protein n=1 Tax=Geomonas sp. RF6 TaxID=2897342 RepID=UPI001E314DFE|nr:hypothetical protein [Geomonas sp. RF6]UFS69855.1 hypothetical protein LPW11_18440 [Geomonas sp. RF6]
MTSWKKSTVAALIFCLVSSPCLAAAENFKEVFLDALYGGITGGLIGAAVMAFTKEPSRHLEYLGYGFGGGALLGAAYGTVRSVKSFAEVENGKVKFAIPTVIPDIQETKSNGKTPFVVTAQLLHGKF